MAVTIDAGRDNAFKKTISWLGRWRRELASNWSITIGLFFIIVTIVSSVFAPFIAPHDPLDQDLGVALLPPAWMENGRSEYPLGTDYVGRDILSRIIYGSRVSLSVAVGGVLVASALGIIFALIAGYTGGAIDALIMRLTDIILSVPFILFVIFVISVLGPSLTNVIIVFSVASFPLFTRLVRGEVLTLRESQFVEAAICSGAKPWRIIRIHLLPNIIGTVITMATFQLATLVLWEASLGFLGLSVSPIIPSWGNMMAEGRVYLRTAWWLVTIPGAAVMCLTVGINLTGDWVRFKLDPRSRGTK